MREIHNSINREFNLCRWQNGIKLIKPEIKRSLTLSNSVARSYDLQSFLKMPFNVHFVVTQSVIQEINESTIQACGFISKRHAIGNRVEIAASRETALREYVHDQKVMEENKLIILQEDYQAITSDINVSFIAFKFPWYSLDNKTIGVFGCCLPLDGTFANTLSLLISTGLLNTTEINFSNYAFSKVSIDGIRLSRREAECIRLLCNGLIVKQIAKALRLSHRTVENYIVNIKCKLNVSTRAQLVEKIRALHSSIS